MDALKRKRSAQVGSMTKVYHKLQKAQTEGDTLLNIHQLKRNLTSLDNAFETYKAIHDEIIQACASDTAMEEEEQALEQQTEF